MAQSTTTGASFYVRPPVKSSNVVENRVKPGIFGQKRWQYKSLAITYRSRSKIAKCMPHEVWYNSEQTFIKTKCISHEKNDKSWHTVFQKSICQLIGIFISEKIIRYEIKVILFNKETLNNLKLWIALSLDSTWLSTHWPLNCSKGKSLQNTKTWVYNPRCDQSLRCLGWSRCLAFSFDKSILMSLALLSNVR